MPLVAVSTGLSLGCASMKKPSGDLDMSRVSWMSSAVALGTIADG